MTTTEKLIEKLEASFAKLGLMADNIRISYPQGFWKKEDCYRWEGSATLYYPDGRPHRRVQINSWDTATLCIAKGELLLKELEVYSWEIWSPSSWIREEAAELDAAAESLY